MSKLYDPKSFQESVPSTPRSYRKPVEEEEENLGPQPTSEELDMFKQQVQQWAKLDDQMRKLSVALRERRVQQKALGSKIQEFMIKYKYDSLNTSTGRINSSVRQVKQPYKVQEIKEKVVQMAGEQMALQIFNDETRPLVERRSIRRIVPKVSMSLDI
jgi:seryl-tRNA synthetase